MLLPKKICKNYFAKFFGQNLKTEYYRYVKLRDGFYKGLVNRLQKTGIRNGSMQTHNLQIWVQIPVPVIKL